MLRKYRAFFPSMRPTVQLVVTVLLGLILVLNIRILSQTDYVKQGDPLRALIGEQGHDITQQHLVNRTANNSNVSEATNVTEENQMQSIMKGRDDQPTLHLHSVSQPRSSKGFLTIGIPSIKRTNGETYLMQTIASVVKTTTDRDKARVVLVVFLSDFDKDYNTKICGKISERYAEYITTGFIHIVQADENMYPNLANLKRNFNDKPERVKWRSKQVVDFALMFTYSANISEYYVQLEDDVYCAPNFVGGIAAFIAAEDKKTEHWALLEFSELGFIGKLVRSADLKRFADYLLLFFYEQPVDWLLTSFRLSMAQRNIKMCKPTLFQHQGLVSSFDTSHLNKLKDRFFVEPSPDVRPDNPSANVQSSMGAFQQHMPYHAYLEHKDKFFWATNPQKGDFITVEFENPQDVDRILIETGNDKVASDDDRLQAGEVYVSQASTTNKDGSKVDADQMCQHFKSLGSFVEGHFEMKDISEDTANVGKNVKCLRISVKKTQKNWIIFKVIYVYLEKKSSQNNTSTGTAKHAANNTVKPEFPAKNRR